MMHQPLSQHQNSPNLHPSPEQQQPSDTTTSEMKDNNTKQQQTDDIPPPLMDLLPSQEFHQKYDLQLTNGGGSNNGGKEGDDQPVASSSSSTTNSTTATFPIQQQSDDDLPAASPSSSSVEKKKENRGRESVIVGKGAFGSVLLCTSKGGGQQVGVEKCAVKIIHDKVVVDSTTTTTTEGDSSTTADQEEEHRNEHRRKQQQQHSASLSGRTELKILQMLQHHATKRFNAGWTEETHHPHLMHLKDCFPLEHPTRPTTATATSESLQRKSSDNNSSKSPHSRCALVLPFVDGGDLFDEINARGYYPEHEAKSLLFGLLEGLVHLHEDLGIAHRDIKPENILLHRTKPSSTSSSSSFSHPTHGVLADFGLAGRVPSYECCGSPMYAAPELLLARRRGVPYTSKVDLYSLGIVAYAVLTSNVPFTGSNEEIMKHTIQSTITYRARNGWNRVTVTAKQFVQGLLDKDPRDRFSARQALQHPWFIATSVDRPTTLKPTIHPNDPLVGLEPIEAVHPDAHLEVKKEVQQETTTTTGSEDAHHHHHHHHHHPKQEDGEGDAVPPPSQHRSAPALLISPALESREATASVVAPGARHLISPSQEEERGGGHTTTEGTASTTTTTPITVETALPPQGVLPSVKQEQQKSLLVGKQIDIMSTESNLSKLSPLLHESVTNNTEHTRNPTPLTANDGGTTDSDVNQGISSSSAQLVAAAISAANSSASRLPSTLLEGSGGLPFTKTSSSDGDYPPGIQPGSYDG